MAVNDALGHYDPLPGETSNYIDAQDAKNAIIQTYSDMAAADNTKVNRSGDTMTGSLNIITASGSASLTLKGVSSVQSVYADVGNENARNVYINNVRRWKESFTGSSWSITNFDSGGTSQGNALLIDGATGNPRTSAVPSNSADITNKAYVDAVGTWTTYNPSTKGGYTENAGSTYKYTQIGKTVILRANVFVSAVTGDIYFSLPLPSASNEGEIRGMGTFIDVDGARYEAQVFFVAYVRIRAISAAGTYASGAVCSSTIPFTWANNDRFNVTMIYETT